MRADSPTGLSSESAPGPDATRSRVAELRPSAAQELAGPLADEPHGAGGEHQDDLAGERQDGAVGRLFELTSDPLAAISADGRFLLLNPAWERLLGWSLSELRTSSVSAIMHPDDLKQARTVVLDGEASAAEAATGKDAPDAQREDSLDPERSLDLEDSPDSDGSRDLDASPDADGSRDLDASPDADGSRDLDASPDADGSPDAETRPPEPQIENLTTRFRHHDGSWRWLLWSAHREGETWYASAKDVTDQVWLERQALHDPLTGLPNRLLLMDRARQAIARQHRSEGVVAMLFIDLDRFKAVNDRMGHGVGDRLLISVAERLAELMRDSDTVARLGGDEFVILAEDIEGEAEALALARRAQEAMEKPFGLGSTEVTMLASVGVAVSHTSDVEPEGMLREADLAMYRAKSAGGPRVRLFDETLRREVSAHAEIEVRLRDALPRSELVLAYQPILRLTGGQTVGAEALIRWLPRDLDGQTGDVLLPSSFLPPVEDSELIVQIGNWVLHTVCVQAAIWRRSGIALPVSVNVSGRELIELDLAERVREELSYSRLPGRALRLEVSEDAVLRDPERARAALEDVKRLGVSIALDKFGSGAFSLSLLSDLPLDTVKLDPLLTRSFDHDRGRRAMFAAAITLAREASLTAVAVGIETNRQLALARAFDCSIGQGFLLQSPASADRVRLRDGSGSVAPHPWRPVVRLRGREDAR